MNSKKNIILYLPLITYIVSSIILVYLYHTSEENIWAIPQISQTHRPYGSSKSYSIYLVSFVIIGIISGLFYGNYIYLPDKPIVSRIIQCLGFAACFLNIVQGFFTLKAYPLIHEISAYGGIFLHLVALSLWIYINPKQLRGVQLSILLSWISIFVMFILLFFCEGNKKRRLQVNNFFNDMGEELPPYCSYNGVGASQRLCVLFLLLSLVFFK
ncbi:MAG: hypothetical protein CMD29_03060 [Flavobacteriales bacterium]|nr:hypothetical protein [Flavobacteriales bacterium]|tara:strand:+ start:684 stop:1322 length:639 start_codon:yes stop_codon:yes gene_type:complete